MCFEKVPVIKVAAGLLFGALLTVSGQVYTWGQNDYYQLGHNDIQNRLEPTRISEFVEKKIFIQDIAAGNQHMLAVTNKITLYAWGRAQAKYGEEIRNRFNEIIGYQNIAQLPEKKPAVVFESEIKDPIIKICAAEQNALITKSGKLYMWGDNSECQLGIIINEQMEIQQVTQPILI